MFSLCPNFTPRACQQSNEQNQFHQFPCGGKQIKGGYLLRYKKQILWNTWCEEWVVLYDDSTMAWFTEPGKSSPSGKVLVKEAPEMLAISQWTSQVPRRPPIPEGCSLSQLIALGSRRKRSKVYWMLAQSEHEVSEWIAAISKTLPPAPQIELILEKTHFGVLKRPLVRIRPSSNAEVLLHKHEERYSSNIIRIHGQTPIAVIKKNSNQKGTLACTIPWGYGWGWVTLPNGLWNGALTWSQCDDSILLHALPLADSTNMFEGCEVYSHVESHSYGIEAASTIEDVTAEDYDYAVDCGDFFF
ncbi:uncharacterized protein [Chironomus tepperi]|uniref:uncharacterized protein isoform X2 n=1 Tax=Chironomus tepperi TaxID=113505 RepID=UPI00391F871E